MMVNSCYMIGMLDNDISKRYMEITRPNAEEMLDCDIRVFDAIQPNTITDEQHNKFAAIKSPTFGTMNSKPFTDTEKAVWLSHLTLWRKIVEEKRLDRSAWVLEHDALISKPPTLFPGCSSIFANDVGQALAYTMRPHILKRLIAEWDNDDQMDMQIDTFMSSWFRRHHQSKKAACLFFVDHLTEFGTTIRHL